MNEWLAAIAVGLVAVIAKGAEETPVKVAEVPEVLRDQVINGLAKGAPTKFFKLDAAPPEGKWRAEFQRDGKPYVFLISTRERVADGKTNTVIVRYEPKPAPQK